MYLLKAVKSIPLYQELYSSILNDENKPITDILEKLPSLTKELMVANFPENWMTYELQNLMKQNLHEFMQTSGSTSERTFLIRPKNFWLTQDQLIFDCLHQSHPNYSLMESKAILTTAICSNTVCYREMPPLEKRIVNGILHLNITPNPYNWTKENIQQIIDEIDEFKPQCLQADPHYLIIFFKYIKKFRLKLPQWTPKILVLTYEKILKNTECIIKKHWNIPIIIFYGTTETGFLAYRDDKNKFHLIHDKTFFNFKPIDETKKHFELFITSFRNPYMPLINFQTNDLMSITNNKDEPKIIELMGRKQESLTDKNSEVFSLGLLDNAINKFNENIYIFQLDLSISNCLYFYYSLFNKTQISSETEKDIIQYFKNTFGHHRKIHLIEKQELSPANSGKFILIKG